MQKPKRKGQGAMEYLMVYGWAILVVVVVGVALWYLGVFKLGGTAKTFEGFGSVMPDDFAITAGTPVTVNMSILNAHGQKINVTTVYCGTGSTPGTFFKEISIGEHGNVGISCTGINAGVGEMVKANITMAYTAMDTNIGHRSSGTLNGPAG